MKARTVVDFSVGWDISNDENRQTGKNIVTNETPVHLMSEAGTPQVQRTDERMLDTREVRGGPHHGRTLVLEYCKE